MEQRDPAIGERIMTMRRRRGLTQMDLAKQTQIPRTVINRLESGLQSVYAERLATIARVLGVSSDYLLGLTLETPDIGQAAGVARRRRHTAVAD